MILFSHVPVQHNPALTRIFRSTFFSTNVPVVAIDLVVLSTLCSHDTAEKLGLLNNYQILLSTWPQESRTFWTQKNEMTYCGKKCPHLRLKFFHHAMPSLTRSCPGEKNNKILKNFHHANFVCYKGHTSNRWIGPIARVSCQNGNKVMISCQ